MCLVIDKSVYTGIHIAKKPLVCYKVVKRDKGNLVPLIMGGNVVYTLGIPNKEVDIDPKVDGVISPHSVEISKGYHSVKTLKEAERILRVNIAIDAHIYKCIIPKKSQYVADRKGYMVSSNIILQEHIPTFIVGSSVNSTKTTTQSYNSAQDEITRERRFIERKNSPWKLVYEKEDDNSNSYVYLNPPSIAHYYILKR